MTDDGFTDGFCLGKLCIEGFEEVEGDDTALELKGEVGAGLILGRCADVVEETGQEVCFWPDVPGGEVLFCYCLS